ncbi:hypothetical protein AAG906_036968 [Vitis piasezkii]
MDNEGGLIRRPPSNMSEFMVECLTKYTLNEDDIKIADYVFDDTRDPMKVLCLYEGHPMTRLQMHYLRGHNALDLVKAVGAMAFNAPKSLILQTPLSLPMLFMFVYNSFIPLMLFTFTILHDILK